MCPYPFSQSPFIHFRKRFVRCGWLWLWLCVWCLTRAAGYLGSWTWDTGHGLVFACRYKCSMSVSSIIIFSWLNSIRFRLDSTRIDWTRLGFFPTKFNLPDSGHGQHYNLVSSRHHLISLCITICSVHFSSVLAVLMHRRKPVSLSIHNNIRNWLTGEY